MKVRLECTHCGFEKVIEIIPDEDGIYTIPNKYCPDCLHKLGRELVEKDYLHIQETVEDIALNINTGKSVFKRPILEKPVISKDESINSDNQTTVSNPIS